MKNFVVICVFGLMALAVAKPSEHYTDKYDNVNLPEVLKNRRLLIGYMNCVLGEGNCTPDGKELKLNIPEAIENDCAKCTETQRSGSRTVIAHLINHEPEYWNRLKAKFDPESKHAARHEKELKELKA